MLQCEQYTKVPAYHTSKMHHKRSVLVPAACAMMIIIWYVKLTCSKRNHTSVTLADLVLVSL